MSKIDMVKLDCDLEGMGTSVENYGNRAGTESQLNLTTELLMMACAMMGPRLLRRFVSEGVEYVRGATKTSKTS